MNLYLAAVYTNNYRKDQQRYAKLTDAERGYVDTIPNILESYHYVHSQKFVDDMRRTGAQVFLDSGAFSAKSLGVDINIFEYIEYIKRNEDIIRKDDGILMASVLDGIGDPLQTWRNQLQMEDMGAKPLPCFHFGEDPRYLEWYVDRYEYITIGGMVRTKPEDVMNWLDRIWQQYMLDGAGRPKLKVHAFGVTTISLMERYPWHSVDSSSWIQAAAFGSIYTNEFGVVTVSSKSPSRHDMGRHVFTLSDLERAEVQRMLSKKGFDVERLSTVYESRAAYNCLAYVELGDKINQRAAANDGRYIVHGAQQLFA
jgi:hypothetical protein